MKIEKLMTQTIAIEQCLKKSKYVKSPMISKNSRPMKIIASNLPNVPTLVFLRSYVDLAFTAKKTNESVPSTWNANW